MTLFTEQDEEAVKKPSKAYKIAVAGTGYVGLSLAVLLAQHNKVTAVDILPEKVEKLKNFISPIKDTYIEKYLEDAKAGTRELNITATTNAAKAYKDADFIIIGLHHNRRSHQLRPEDQLLRLFGRRIRFKPHPGYDEE